MVEHQNTMNADGDTLFQRYCSPCHSLDFTIIGPKLKGISKNRDRVWLKSFIKNGMQLVKENDSSAVAIFNKFNKVEHPDFSNEISDGEIDKIIFYME